MLLIPPGFNIQTKNFAMSRKQPTAETLIQEICSKLCHNAPSRVHNMNSYALRMLSDLGSFPIPNSDESSVLQKIHRDLAAKGRQKDAAEISMLYRKLSANERVQNLWAVLHLMRSLSKEKSGKYANGTLSFRQGVILSSTPVSETLSVPDNTRNKSSTGFSSVKSARFTQSTLPSDVPSMSLGSRLAWTMTPGHSTKHRSKLTNSTQVTPSTVPTNLTRNSTTSLNAKSFVNEGAILREIVIVFQGIETDHIKYSEREKGFRLVPNSSVDGRNIQLIHRLCQLGWLHNKIRKYIDKHAKDLAFGLVGQAFCAALVQELREYYRFLTVIQSQIHEEDQGIGGEERISLCKLFDSVAEPMERLQWICMLVDNCRDKKGGALASTVHAFMQTGCVNMRLLTKRLLVIVTQPIFFILSRWIYHGELQDTFHEFFVAMDPMVSSERLWYDKYHLRQSMVPSFINEAQARKILLVGKSLNFLRLVCHDRTEIKIKNKQEFQLPEDAYLDSSLNFGNELQERVDEAYLATSRCLLDVLNRRYKLMTHLSAIRKFLLLGQGDFVRHLLDLVHDDLAKPANQLYRHNLNGLVETALRATNAQFEDQDVQTRLDIRLLEINPGDTGWDVFSLDYHVDQPLNTVVTPEIMLFYLRIFNFLWRARRMEHNLAQIWTDTMEQSDR